MTPGTRPAGVVDAVGIAPDARAVILVEGLSDRIAPEVLAALKVVLTRS